MKIYNVKMVKTEMARGLPKLCRNQNPFGSLQTNPQAGAWWVKLYLFVKKKCFLVLPSVECAPQGALSSVNPPNPITHSSEMVFLCR